MTRSLVVRISMVALVFAVLANKGPASRAADEADATSDVKAKVSQPQVEKAIADLASDDFEVRRQASTLLEKAGSAGIEPIARAADTDNLELAARCIEILKKLYASEDKAIAGAAEAALSKLSRSERRSVAQRAGRILKEDEAGAVANVNANGVQIQLQVIAGAGGNRIQVAQQNQNQEITIEENGKKTHISETTGKGIHITVKETIDGKEKVSEYKAKDLEELKKKHPEAAEIYEKHVPKQQNGGGVIFGNNGRIQFRAAPGIRIAQRVVRNNAPQIAAIDELKKATDEVERIATALEKVKPDEPSSAAEIKKLAKQLGEAKAKLQEVLKDLGGGE